MKDETRAVLPRVELWEIALTGLLGHLNLLETKTFEKDPSMKGSNSREAALLLQILEEGYERKAWHGPNLKGSLRGLKAREAAWRPGPGRHNIWEIAVHAAYWKYVVRRRMMGGRRGAFPLEGSNWFPRPAEPSEKAWRQDRALLEQTHRDLRQAISELFRGKAKRIPMSMLFGVAFHDVYHAGQIRLLRRLLAKRTHPGKDA